jgi:hypothetical protein
MRQDYLEGAEKMNLTREQIENIQIDYGLVYANYGEVGERQLAPTRGGGTFSVTKNIREIEYDGRRGKTKGMQVVDEVNAMLSVPLLCASMENLALAMPWATYSDGKLSAKSADLGVIQDGAYLSNITMFAKVIGGGYKKITLYSAMTENDFSLAAAPKAEGVVTLEVHAHWDAEEDTADLYDIEDVGTISADTTGPTVTTDPDDAETGVAVSSNLTATFSEDIRQGDIRNDNFTLIKASDGTEVSGTLTYSAATKTATFDPTSNLEADTAYIWIIANVRDLAGNKMAKKVVNFQTA